jgi:hypothetical protein
LRKYIVIGNFVEIVSGPLQEQTGWVEGTDGEMVHVVKCISGEKLKDNVKDYHIKVVRFYVHPLIELIFLAKI